jgi:hypothetical protein
MFHRNNSLGLVSTCLDLSSGDVICPTFGDTFRSTCDLRFWKRAGGFVLQIFRGKSGQLCFGNRGKNGGL